MLWTPAAKLPVWKVAVVPLSVPVPNVLVPSRKVTVPVAEPEVAATVPVKVTAVPTITVLCEELTVVIVAVFAIAGLLLVLLLEPPQATSENIMIRISIPSTTPVQRLHFFRPPANTMPSKPILLRLANRIDELRCGTCSEAEIAAVVMVSCTVTGASPANATDGGLKAHVASDGKVLPQLNVSVPL